MWSRHFIQTKFSGPINKKRRGKFDRCAVKVTKKAEKDEKIVGHVPIELSRYVHFVLAHGCKFKVEVLDGHPSPLTQGGLEIESQITLTVELAVNQKNTFFLLKDFVTKNYDFEKNK